VRTKSRGPDDRRIIDTGKEFSAFTALQLWLNPSGIQPYELDGRNVSARRAYVFEKEREL
jgi:hypothetical protein